MISEHCGNEASFISQNESWQHWFKLRQGSKQEKKCRRCKRWMRIKVGRCGICQTVEGLHFNTGNSHISCAVRNTHTSESTHCVQKEVQIELHLIWLEWL